MKIVGHEFDTDEADIDPSVGKLPQFHILLRKTRTECFIGPSKEKKILTNK